MALHAHRVADSIPTPRTRRAAMLALVVTITTMTSAFAPVDARAGEGWTSTRTEFYDMGDPGPLIGAASTGGCGMGTVCFGSPVGESFTVRIQDDSGREVGGVIRVTDSRGYTVIAHSFCGSSGRFLVVRGDMRVFLDAPGDVRGTHWAGGPGCTEIRPFGGTTGATTRGATSGRVQVTFTEP